MYITRGIKANKKFLSSSKLQDVINKCSFVLSVPVFLITVMWIHCHVNCQVLIRYDNWVFTNICVFQKASREVASIVNMQDFHFYITTTGNIESHSHKMEEKLKSGKPALCDISTQNSQHSLQFMNLTCGWFINGTTTKHNIYYIKWSKFTFEQHDHACIKLQQNLWNGLWAICKLPFMAYVKHT